MVKVAIAGGTGGLGLHLVEGILDTGKHEVVVLSRKPTSSVLEKLGVSIIPVSYDDPTALLRALEGVHTVISTIAGTTEAQFTLPQLALLDAAVKAGVKRFVPSEFGARSVPNNPVEVYRPKWPVAEAVRKSGLEYTIFEVGALTNYLAAGTPGIGHVFPNTFGFDIEHCKATLAADTSVAFVWTRAEDVGKFVAASLDLEKWPEYSQMQGDRKTMAEILRIAEEIRGRKFDVTYLTEEQLVEMVDRPPAVGQLDALIAERYGEPNFQKIVAQFWLASLRGTFLGFEGRNLNDLCPQVKPMGVEEFIRKWWAN